MKPGTLIGVYLVITALVMMGGLVQAGPRSGYAFIKPETRAMQDDDFENPGMIVVDKGASLFNQGMSAASSKSCASCHGDDGAKLNPASIAAYPKPDSNGKITTLQDRVVQCANRNVGGRLKLDDENAIALETFVRHLAKGRPVAVDTSGLEKQLQRGKKLFDTRYGLIDMSCQHCHEWYAGKMLRGQLISEGMANSFPAYRLAIGEVVSLSQRIQQCMTLMRAEPFATGSDELRLLELYMMSRSNGLAIETPAVRY